MLKLQLKTLECLDLKNQTIDFGLTLHSNNCSSVSADICVSCHGSLSISFAFFQGFSNPIKSSICFKQEVNSKKLNGINFLTPA